MRLLPILFVLLTVLSSLCTGRTISRALCEKIKTCTYNYKQGTGEKRSADAFFDGVFEKENTLIVFPEYLLFENYLCPGGAPKLKSGKCSSPISSNSYEYDTFYYYK